jgi:hypothetical protein
MVITAKPISRAPLIAAENGSRPFLDVPEDVLQHHDGVVHHQADGQHQRQQGQRVDGEAEQAISAKVPTRLTGMVMIGMMDARKVRRNTKITSATSTMASAMVVHVLHRAVDEHRVVVGDVDADVGRQVLLQLGDHVPHALATNQRVGRGLADHAGRDGIAAVQAGGAALVGGALFHPRHVADLDREAVDVLDHDLG